MEAYAQLLGTPQLRFTHASFEPPLTKATALLYYLAFKGKWCSRDELLYLFYPDTAENAARSSFRQLLSSIRRLPYNQGLIIETGRLRWPIDTDVQAFKQAVHERKCSEAIALYNGKLLESCTLPAASEFESWLEAEREELYRQWRDATFTLVKELEGSARYAQAAEVLTRLYKTDPLDEEVLQPYLQVLYLSSQRSKALTVFASFKKQLHEEYEAEPDDETLQLVGRIERNDQVPPLLSAAAPSPRAPGAKQEPRHNLPVQPTPFVGRAAERERLLQLLGNPSWRLLSIVGPGGMGKTRLALELAREQLDDFIDGVYFVNMVPVASAELMVYSIGQAIGFSFFGQQEPKEQLLDYLRDKEMLLLLDNFEHLLVGVALIGHILEAAPQVTVLATSRVRLDLRAERVYDLRGLEVPEDGAQDAQNADAVTLFTQRAGSVRADFMPNDRNLPAIVRICQLVQGLPLAIELAASWLRALPVEDIATELERGIDFLKASTRDLPERHASIRVVFDSSWQLLKNEEQAVLRQLSVFQSGFRREAAAEVAGASLTLLASLVDKSFLAPTPTGRYRRHPLVLQYTQEKLNEYPWEKAKAAERHGLYYLRFLCEQEADLKTLKRKATLAVIEQELPNIRAAWAWAIENERVDEIKASAMAIHHVYSLSYEAVDLLEQAIAGLDEANPAHHPALGYVLVLLGWYTRHQKQDAEEIVESIQQGLDMLKASGETRGMVLGLRVLGDNVWLRHGFSKVKSLYEEALALAKAHGHDASDLLLSLALLERETSSFSRVKKLFQEALAEMKRQGNALGTVDAKVEFGIYLVRHSFFEEGKQLIEEGLQLAHELDLGAEEAVLLNGLVLAKYKLGDYHEAEALALESLALAKRFGNNFPRVRALANLGRVATAKGDFHKAQRYLNESLRAAWELGYSFVVADAIVYLAELLIAQGKARRAAELLGLAQDKPIFLSEHRLELAPLLETLWEQLSSKRLEEALERGRQMKPEEVVEALLDECA